MVQGREGEGLDFIVWNRIIVVWMNGFPCLLNVMGYVVTMSHHKHELPITENGVIGVLQRGQLNTESLCV